ncbi:hypothetical protein [Actinomadura rubrisoli]|nr:hypothetical protein [Actinomadura rubrisoli]
MGHEVVVATGDYVTYQADTPHRWAAADGPAHVWIVHTYPRPAAFVE